MRILITGVTGGLGRRVAEGLAASGHQVAGLAQQPHPDLDPRVTLSACPLDTGALAGLTDEADVVIHLAPVEPGVAEAAGVTGLLHLANAAARSGTRLIVPIHAGGDPELYRQTEELVTSSWGPTLVLRLAPLIGRLPDWSIERTIATLADTRHGASGPVRLLHTDDLCRFLSRAVHTDHTGQLDVAGSDPITYVSARRLLAGVTVSRGTAVWPIVDPVFRLAPLQRDWHFESGWSAVHAVTDVARDLTGRRLDGHHIAGRVPGVPRSGTPAAAEELVGEFDYPIDPRFPTFSVTDAPDVLPGPLTPITLDVQLGALRGAQRATAELLGLPVPLAAEWESRATAVFGHRVFTGVSVRAALRPGVAMTRRALRAARGYVDRCAAQADAVAAMECDAVTLSHLTDAQSDVRILRLCNQIQRGWELCAVGAAVEGVLDRLARRPGPRIPQPAAMTSTGHLAGETAALAELLRADDNLRRLVSVGDVDAMRRAAPVFTAAFDAAVRRVGHRGPGEAELANPVIADEPGQLLAAAELASGENRPAPQPAPPADPLGRRAWAIRTARESAWDSTARATHQLRTTLRAKASRLVDAGTLADAGDIFYLTRHELLAPPPDVATLVARRRAEHVRLQKLSLPDVFEGAWVPVDHTGSVGEAGAVAAQVLAPAARSHFLTENPTGTGRKWLFGVK